MIPNKERRTAIHELEPLIKFKGLAGAAGINRVQLTLMLTGERPFTEAYWEKTLDGLWQIIDRIEKATGLNREKEPGPAPERTTYKNDPAQIILEGWKINTAKKR